MKVIQRELRSSILKASRRFGAVVLSGPRRAGKTFLLRHAFPRASYHLLEDPDVLARVKADPRGWLDAVRAPAIVDEIQNAPELFSYIRTRIDEDPRKGRWLLTGSQDFSLMAGVSESMAGRAAVFHLAPLSFREVGSWNLLRGGYPEVVLRPGHAGIWFTSYLQTYLERDVRALKAVKDLMTFRRFLSLLAARHGQILNRSDIAAPLGISSPTVSEWLGVLETTGQIFLVPPYFQNFGKRLIKSPKLYWTDPGLACFLLGIETEKQLESSPFVGPVFEGFIGSEILKNQANQGRRRELYFFRDEQGLEVDFIAPAPSGRICLIEAKWSRTPRPDMAAPLQKLARAIPDRAVEAVVVHRASRSSPGFEPLARGVTALPVEDFLARFPGKVRGLKDA